MDTILKLHVIISKGHCSANNIAAVKVLILYTSSDAFMKISSNIIKVIEQTRVSLEKNQRGIISEEVV